MVLTTITKQFEIPYPPLINEGFFKFPEAATHSQAFYTKLGPF